MTEQALLNEVVGLDRIAPKSPALLAINHSLATYDTLLLCGVIIERLGRVPSGLGDRLIFKTPRLRRIATAAGIVEATHENGAELLRRNRLVIVAPGGMREALRQSDERYRVRWDRRKGFVRLALRTGAPIQLVACPNADRMYRVYESDLTKLVYKRLRAPVPLIRGWGPTLIPRPVKLLHLIGERMQPEALDEARFEEQVDDDIVQRLADEASHHRRLLIAGVDLDLGIGRAWELALEAARGRPGRVRRMLLASTALPPGFPPVAVART